VDSIFNPSEIIRLLACGVCSQYRFPAEKRCPLINNVITIQEDVICEKGVRASKLKLAVAKL
jgi:hypothetical protein